MTFYYAPTLGDWGGDLDFPLSVCPSEFFLFCDKGGKVGASVSYGDISSFV